MIAAIVLSVVLFMAWAADDALLAVELVAWAAMLFLSLVTFRRAVLTLAAVFGRDKKGRNDAPEPNVLVLIPARDEADVILSCLDSVRRLDWPAEKLRVVVIDDGSGDGTGAVVASESERDARIRVLRRSAPRRRFG
ncbi:MAG: glycosyltransferase [Deltaproteobacteria bacterium]|nr:glycosyltransferase [Deltaproteobacteria bacterium]